METVALCPVMLDFHRLTNCCATKDKQSSLEALSARYMVGTHVERSWPVVFSPCERVSVRILEI